LEYGFDGITVALLGRANPVGIVAAALLFGALKAGALSAQPDVPVDISTLLQATIVLFIAAPALVKAILHLRTPRGGLITLEAKGW
jgi:simple sugar transport system permease protein